MVTIPVRRPLEMTSRSWLIVSLLVLTACRERGGVPPGFSPCQGAYALHYLEELVSGPDDLTALGLSTDLSATIVGQLAGPDGLRGSDDDRVFRDFEELRALAGWRDAELSALVDVASRGFCPGTDRVVFAPGPGARSHVARLVDAIERAERSLDVAIYAVADEGLEDALRRAAQGRGVSIRILYDGARADRDGSDWSRTVSGRLEALGAEVRWVNAINHHKFAIIDGPRTSLAQAARATLVSGSANWGAHAADRYDESTVFIEGDPTVVLPFQQEFNRLWEGSRGRRPASPATVAVTDASLGSDPVEVLFTSVNFDVEPSVDGPVFSPREGSTVVQDRLVELIRSAEQSVWVASAHLRLRAIAEALLERRVARPAVDVRVYVDQQEYIDEQGIMEESAELDACTEDTRPHTAERDGCDEMGRRFASLLQQAGVPVRFKTYSYGWEMRTSRQMHHKYIVIDGRVVVAGSYNLSNNAEQHSLENMVVYRGARFPDIVRAYIENFEAIWETGLAERRYDRLLHGIRSTDEPIPIDFAPMALDWGAVGALRRAIAEGCPEGCRR